MSIASISASVSLLRIQSISCRWERSPELSNLRSPGILPVDPALDFGKAFRPSNNSTKRRSTKRMVSSTHLSSPCNALSIESGSSDLRRSYKENGRKIFNTFALYKHTFCERLIIKDSKTLLRVLLLESLCKVLRADLQLLTPGYSIWNLQLWKVLLWCYDLVCKLRMVLIQCHQQQPFEIRAPQLIHAWLMELGQHHDG